MRGKTAKMLRKMAADTGQYKNMKNAWRHLCHIEKGQIRAAFKHLSSIR